MAKRHLHQSESNKSSLEQAPFYKFLFLFNYYDLNSNIESDSSCFCLAAKQHIDYLESISSKSNDKSDDVMMLSEDSESSTSLSLKYKVLCKSTSYFGKVKNLSKSTEEMKTVEVVISKLKQSDYGSLKTRGSWNIPNYISNWKNIKGCAIPLGGGLNFLNKKSWHPSSNLNILSDDIGKGIGSFYGAPGIAYRSNYSVRSTCHRSINPSASYRGGRGCSGRGGDESDRIMMSGSMQCINRGSGTNGMILPNYGDSERCLRRRSRSGSRSRSDSPNDRSRERAKSRKKCKRKVEAPVQINAEKILFECKEVEKLKEAECEIKNFNSEALMKSCQNVSLPDSDCDSFDDNETCQPNFNGSFSSLPSKFESVIKIKYPKDIENLKVENSLKHTIWLTLIAICIIKKIMLKPQRSTKSTSNIFNKIRSNSIFGSTLFKKSMNFLKANGLSNIDALVSEVSELISNI